MRPFYQPLVDQAFSVDWPSSLHAGDLDVFANLNHGVPIRTGAVDTIVASDLLEHLVEPAAFLAECHRILRPQGHLVGNVPFMYWLHEAPHDYFRYTEHGLRFLLGRAGFAQVAIEPLAGGLDIPVDVISKLLTKIPVVGDWIARGLQRFWMLVRRFPPLKKAYPVFPLCYGFTAQK
ncbi:MAG: methyltransferase domain protein [Acidimicrobiales bacterium]|nr:methyltransferase domain protein [Acidimicrobiales bacterium]